MAFPTAVGAGRFSKGGRGGQVLFVDTLADSLDPGTFRHALSIATGPRTVIFRVSGYIDLLDDVGIFDPYITIAGQTAPGDGICIRNGSVAVRTNDVIIRHMRFRPGDAAFPGTTASDPQDRDGIKIQGGSNVMIDHCSLTWGVDENLSTWVQDGVYPSDITVQNSIIAEGLYNSIHPDGNHSRGFLIGDGTDRLTLIHSLLMSNNRRNPHIKGGTTGIEVVNNIIYNWGSDSNTPAGVGNNFSNPEGSGPTVAAVVNNIFGQGPNLGTAPMSFAGDVDAGSSILLGGNIGDTDDAAFIAAYPYVTAAPSFPSPELNWSVANILSKVGARVPAVDSVDSRLISEVTSNGGALIDSPSDVGGYPALASGTPYPDADADGMDDAWEVVYGLNPKSPDNNGFDFGNGYTNLENFLNILAGDAPVINQGDNFGQIFGNNSRRKVSGSNSRRSITASRFNFRRR